MKELMALGATLLIIVAYVPYVKDVLSGKTKPHVYSWFLSALVTLIAFGLQLSEGAGWGMLPTFVASIAGFAIFILALNHQKRAPIVKADTFFLFLTLTAIVLWLVVDKPLLSVLLISCIDIFAFIPTFRKSWERPDEETVSSYAINSVRFTLATLAVQKFTLVSVLYPVSQTLADGLFAIFLILRRRNIAKHLIHLEK